MSWLCRSCQYNLDNIKVAKQPCQTKVLTFDCRPVFHFKEFASDCKEFLNDINTGKVMFEKPKQNYIIFAFHSDILWFQV